MSVPASKQQLKEWCLRQLGWPVIDINVDDAYSGITNSVRMGNMILTASNISELKKNKHTNGFRGFLRLPMTAYKCVQYPEHKHLSCYFF